MFGFAIDNKNEKILYKQLQDNFWEIKERISKNAQWASFQNKKHLWTKTQNVLCPKWKVCLQKETFLIYYETFQLSRKATLNLFTETLTKHTDLVSFNQV